MSFNASTSIPQANVCRAEVSLKNDHDNVRQACSIPLPKPTSILSLPDHIIQQIGGYISEDNHIPYPAFGPTWHSLLPQRSSLRPLRDFRAISQQIRRAVPLSGTWLVVNTMADLQKYAWMSDDELVGSVTRLKLKIDDGYKDNSSNGVISIVSHLMRLLQRTPNLRELRIARPVHPGEKHHVATRPPLTSLHVPVIHLPHLQHLYVKIACDDCASGLEAFLISLTPGLHSLKLYLPDTKGCEPLTSSFEVHRARFGTPLISLRLLFLRVGPVMDVEGLFVVLAEDRTGLAELHISTYEKKEMRITLEVQVTTIEGDGEGYEAHKILKNGRLHLKSFWDDLGSLSNLEVLDLGMTLSDGDSEIGPPPVARNPITTTELQVLESAQATWQARQTSISARRIHIQRSAAEYLVSICPKLRKGWWWDRKYIEQHPSGELVYERRGWVAEMGDDDKVAIRQNEGVLWLSTDFVSGYQ